MYVSCVCSNVFTNSMYVELVSLLVLQIRACQGNKLVLVMQPSLIPPSVFSILYVYTIFTALTMPHGGGHHGGGHHGGGGGWGGGHHHHHHGGGGGWGHHHHHRGWGVGHHHHHQHYGRRWGWGWGPYGYAGYYR